MSALHEEKLSFMKGALPGQLAKYLFVNFSDRCRPVRVVQIAKELGIQIFNSEGLGIGLRAVASRKGPEMKINLCKGMPLVVSRFCIAHAMYRLLSQGDGIYHQTQGSNGQGATLQESMANEFALYLLIPSDRLEKDLLDTKKSIAEIAQIYEVSELALGLRAKEVLSTI